MTASSVPTTVRDQLRTLVAGRTVVLATARRAAGEAILRQLDELGADRILVLGPRGLGPLAFALDAEFVEVDLGDENSAATQLHWEELLADPPSGLRNLLDARDPDRNALVLVSPGLATVDLLGRPVFGARHSGWSAPEDTLPAEWLWEAAGVPAASDGGGTHPAP